MPTEIFRKDPGPCATIVIPMIAPPRQQVTQILIDWTEGDPEAADRSPFVIRQTRPLTCAEATTNGRMKRPFAPRKFSSDLFPRDTSISIGRGRARKCLNLPGELTEGENYLRRALERAQAKLPPGNRFIAVTQGALGENLLMQGRFTEADEALQISYRELNPGSAKVILKP